ncbi:MAG: MFS transporter [Betaproteobacteria bacterium]
MLPSAPLALALSLWLNAVMVAATLALLAVPILAPLVLPALGLPAEALGLYSGALWGASLITSVAAGSLIRRRGAWRVAQACLLLTALGLLCGAAGAVAGLLLAALAIGLAVGLETPAASQLLARGLTVAQRPLYFSIKQTGVQAGGLLGALTLPWLAAQFGWQASLVALALLALLLMLALEQPRRRLGELGEPGEQGGRGGPGQPTEGPATAPLHFKAALAWAWREPLLRRLALAAAAFGAVQLCLNSFMVTYAVLERGATLAQAGLLLGVAQGGGLLGRLLWGWVAGRHGHALALLRAIGVAMTIAAALLGGLGSGLATGWLLPLVFIFGLTASGWNGVFLAEIAQQVPLARVAAATGAVLVVMTVGLMLAPLLFAAIGAARSFGAAYLVTAFIAAAGTLCLPGASGAKFRS